MFTMSATFNREISPTATATDVPRELSPYVPIVANPYSGNGPNRKHVEHLAESLSQAGLEPVVFWEPERRHALLTDPQLSRKVRCVVCAGGDGSLGDMVNELDEGGHLETLPVSTLPIGNENLFARQFGYDLDIASITRAIVAMETATIDLGRAGGRLFTLMASAGFDAEVVHRMARWRSGSGELRRVTSMAYAPKILRTIATYDYTKLRVETDDQVVEGSHLFVFNLPQYGGGLGLAKHARADDAMLDWIVFEKPGILSLTDYAWTVLRAKHLGRPDVPHGRTAKLRVTSQTPVPMQADGDPAGWTPIEVTVCPAVMQIVAMPEGVPK